MQIFLEKTHLKSIRHTTVVQHIFSVQCPLDLIYDLLLRCYFAEILILEFKVGHNGNIITECCNPSFANSFQLAKRDSKGHFFLLIFSQILSSLLQSNFLYLIKFLSFSTLVKFSLFAQVLFFLFFSQTFSIIPIFS